MSRKKYQKMETSENEIGQGPMSFQNIFCCQKMIVKASQCMQQNHCHTNKTYIFQVMLQNLDTHMLENRSLIENIDRDRV